MDDWVKEMIKNMKELEKEYEENNVKEHYEVHDNITDIIGYIQDWVFWGTLVDLETGEEFTLTTGVNMINDLLKDIDDEKFVSYEKSRLDEILQSILK